MQTSAHTSPCPPVKQHFFFLLLAQGNSWLLWLHTFYFIKHNYSMMLNLPLILFQARESEMPSWNILQICANLRPPHAPVVAICPVSFTIICFYASPSPNPHSPKRNDICILTDRQTLTPWFSFRSWWLILALHHRSTWFLKCNLSTTMYVFPSLLDTAVTPLCTRFKQQFFKWQASS